MDQQGMDQHFHTPSAKQGRFAIGKDVFLHKFSYLLPDSKELAHCAVCGKVIRPAAKSRHSFSLSLSLVHTALCLALYLLGYLVATRFYLYCVILCLFSPLFALAAKHLADAFSSWEVVEYRSPESLSLLERLDRHPSRDRDASWYVKWFNLPLFIFALQRYIFSLLLNH